MDVKGNSGPEYWLQSVWWPNLGQWAEARSRKILPAGLKSSGPGLNPPPPPSSLARLLEKGEPLPPGREVGKKQSRPPSQDSLSRP